MDRGITVSVIIIGILFFIFGFVTWLNSVLIPYLKISCELNNLESFMVAFSFYVAYLVMGVPSAKISKFTRFKGGISLRLFVIKQFVSWASLAPNNKVSRKKVFGSKIPKRSNCLEIALRQVASATGNIRDTRLSDFFKRIASRKGRQAAVSATARKHGVIVWAMVTKRLPYVLLELYRFLDQNRKLGLAERIINK